MKYLFQGLQILMKYWPESTDANAQDGELFVGGDKSQMSQEDVDALLALPYWHYHDEFDCWYFAT